MLITTRRGLSYALSTQQPGGFAVRVVGFLVFRDTPSQWRLVRTGSAMNEFEMIGAAGAIIDRLFPQEARS